MSAAAQPLAAPAPAVAGRVARWWPLAALTLLAAVLRLSTLNLQSFWYDEAYTAVHVLRPSLSATLHHVAHGENSPPLWYLLAWISYRLFGNGEVALRLPSALAGIALVPVAWGVGRELGGRYAAIATAAFVAVGPIFVWYSQEARVYGLYMLTSGIATLCFLRALDVPSRGRMAAFALAGAVALATHYFAVFLLAAAALWLLADARTRRPALPALGAIAIAGLALVPLIHAQGGRNTGWIGHWALLDRLEAIPRYFLVGYNGASLGGSIMLLVALPLLGAAGLGLWRMLERPPSRRTAAETARTRAAAIALSLAACELLVPLALALLGQDYLAPRNVLAAMLPVAALIALLGTWPRAGVAGGVLLALGAAGLAAMTIDIFLSPRQQRADWRGLAATLPAPREPAYVTTLLGSVPLQYYLPGEVRSVPRSAHVSAREVIETGEQPLLRPEGRAPGPGFVLAGRTAVHGLVAVRWVAAAPRTLSVAALRHDRLDDSTPWVLTPGSGRMAR